MSLDGVDIVDGEAVDGAGATDGAVVLPDGYVVLGACAIVDESAGAALGADDGVFIAPLGAGDVLCAVCELVEPPEAESAEPLWPLDCAYAKPPAAIIDAVTTEAMRDCFEGMVSP